MVKVRPFKGLRPPKEIVATVSCLPYDVMNTEEAARMAKGDERSLLNITRAEICCPKGTDVHSDVVYSKAKENFDKARQMGWLVQDGSPCYYIYEQTMDGRRQCGIVAAVACEDYENGLIKKHELTRHDKEEDRMVLTRWLGANIEPVFLAYKSVGEIDAIIERVKEGKPEYDFVSDDGVGHRLWVLSDKQAIFQIERLFEDKVPATYVADGHHRTAAAARIGREFAANNPHHTGNESYNFFMAVIFPDSQLHIMDYNRVVKDLNGMTSGQFIEAIQKVMSVERIGNEPYRPSRLHEFSMYLDGSWYRLRAKEGTYDDNDPIGILDVSVLSNNVLTPILGIEDMRKSQRIDFVGGIRGLSELSRLVDDGQARVAFALYPVSMKQLTDIADTGNIMPPKTTWFEPKLRSGLFVKLVDSSSDY